MALDNKMNAKSLAWLILRLALVLIPVVLSLTHPEKNIYPDWRVMISIPIALVVGLSIWLHIKTSQNINYFYEPFSFTKPFLPMRLYPLRFLIVCSEILIFLGISSILSSYIRYGQLTGKSIFFVIGVSVLIPTLACVFFHKNPTG